MAGYRLRGRSPGAARRRVMLLVLLVACADPPPLDCPAGASVVGAPTEGLACEDGDGRRTGPFERRGADGTVLETGRYDAEGRKTGEWTTAHPGGERAKVETWEQGWMNGPWAEWDEDGRKLRSGAYLVGSKHGPWWDWGRDGRPRELTTWAQGQKDGPAVSWHDDGDVSVVGHHAAGQQVGLWLAWTEGGTLASATPWDEGLKHGEESVWRRDGALERRSTFARGSIVSEEVWHTPDQRARVRDASGRDEQWYATGQPKLRCLPDGPLVRCERFDDAGRPRAAWTQVDGRRSGPYVERGPSGRVSVEGAYRDGRRTGPWRVMRPDGSLDPDQSGRYADGKRVGPLDD